MMIRGGKEPLSVDDMISEAGDPWPRIKRDIAHTLSGGGIIADRSEQEQRSYNAVFMMVGAIPAGFAGSFRDFMDRSFSVSPAAALSDALSIYTTGVTRMLINQLALRSALRTSDREEFRAIATILAEEHGIQPLVPGLTLMPLDTAKQVYLTEDLEALAGRLLRDPRREAVYQSVITRLLFLLEAQQALHDFNEELRSSSAFEQAGALLKFRDNILSWLWWCARIVDDYEIDWAAHPMPWQLP